jgi:hypothetical protein
MLSLSASSLARLAAAALAAANGGAKMVLRLDSANDGVPP